MKTMRASYAGRCTTCGGSIHVGDSIIYRGKGKTFHPGCYGKSPEGNSPETPTQSPGRKRPTLPPQVGEKVFTVDWHELKSTLLAAFRGDFSAYPEHGNYVQSHLVTPNEGWQGYTGEDTKRWLEFGFNSNAIKNLGDFNPPLRKKRRLLYVEEGDEFHYDLAASGDERFMTTWTERERIPGCKINIALGFQAGVSETVLNRYARWVCKAIYSIIAIGIDPEIVIHYKADGMVSGENGPHDTRIRVKKEQEVMDFKSFSPMLSPAQFRAYMFCAMYLHCESRGRKITGGHGHSSRYFNQWGVDWEKDEKKLYIRCDYHGNNFSEERMEGYLRAALKEMSH